MGKRSPQMKSHWSLEAPTTYLSVISALLEIYVSVSASGCWLTLICSLFPYIINGICFSSYSTKCIHTFGLYCPDFFVTILNFELCLRNEKGSFSCNKFAFVIGRVKLVLHLVTHCNC